MRAVAYVTFLRRPTSLTRRVWRLTKRFDRWTTKEVYFTHDNFEMTPEFMQEWREMHAACRDAVRYRLEVDGEIVAMGWNN